MPPPSARRPDNATCDRVATWLENELDRAAAARESGPDSRVPSAQPHRIRQCGSRPSWSGNRPEGHAAPDEQAFGFDNNADALSMQPALLDRHLAAAEIARLVVGDPTIPAGFERYTALKDNSNETTWLWQNERLGEEFPLGSRAGSGAPTFRWTAITSSRFGWTALTPASSEACERAPTSRFASTASASAS